MNFLQFLIEESKPYKQEISENKAIEVLKKYCSTALKTNNIVYRGIKSNSPFIISDTTKTERYSANTHNYYTILLDHYLSKKNLPLRSKSAICTTDKKYSQVYGTSYVIIPFNDPIFCTVGDNDIWALSFKKSKSKEYIGYEDLNNLYYDLLISDSEDAASIVEEIKHAMKQIIKGTDEKLLKIYGKDTCEELLDVFGSVDNVDNMIDKIYNIDFQHFKYSELDTNKHKNEELWFSGTSLAIRADLYEEFLEENK